MSSIAFFIQNFSRSAGSERVTSILANELVKRDNKVYVISICGDNTCFYQIDPRIELHTLIHSDQVDNRKDFLKVLKALNSFYKKHKIDLCVDIFPSLSIYTLMLKKKYNFKNITWEHYNFKANIGMCKMGRKLAVRYSDEIITLTETDKKFYLENNDDIKANIDSVYNPSPYQNGRIHNCNNKNIISVGRLSAEKGFDRMLKMWEMTEEKTDWNLTILGEGEDRVSLEKIICEKNLRRVKLQGTVSNVDDYYLNSNIYISTSRFEGLPMTMIEAQSFGLPIVSLDFDTGPRDIIENRVSGIIVEEQSDEEQMLKKFSSELLELTKNKERLKMMSEKAFEASARFKTEFIVEEWEKILQKLL